MMLREVIASLHFEANLRDIVKHMEAFRDTVAAERLNKADDCRVPCEATSAPEVLEDE